MSEPHDATRMRLGPLVVPDWLLVVVVCLVPLGFMVARSFGEANPVTLDVEITGSTQSYRSLFGELYRPVLLRSLTLSVLPSCSVWRSALLRRWH